MAELEIIGVPFSNFVWAVRACCEEKGVAYTLTPSRPHTPEVLAIHPFGKIPAMRHGEVTLCETRAIIGYIDAAFPGKKLLPQDVPGAARAEQWLSLCTTTFDQVIMRQFVAPLVFQKVPREQVAPAVATMKKQMAWLEGQLGTGFALGEAFSPVDALLAPMLHYAGMQPDGAALLAEAPNVAAYLKRVLAHPAMVKAAPPPR